MNSQGLTESTPPAAFFVAESDPRRRAVLAAEYQELSKYFQSHSQSAERQYFTSQTYAVRILELLALTGLIALGLTLIRNFDTVGSLAIFLIASLLSILSSGLTQDANRVRFWNQMLWGILVPIAAVVGDPFVFGTYKAGVPVSLEYLSAGVYFALGYSMLLMAASWFLKPTSFPWVNAFLAGQLRCGAVVLIFVGLVLTPITLLGLFSLFGLLGLVPFIAGGVYFRTSAMHYRWAQAQAGSKVRSLFVFGFAIVLIAVAGLTVLGANKFGY